MIDLTGENSLASMTRKYRHELRVVNQLQSDWFCGTEVIMRVRERTRFRLHCVNLRSLHCRRILHYRNSYSLAAITTCEFVFTSNNCVYLFRLIHVFNHKACVQQGVNFKNSQFISFRQPDPTHRHCNAGLN